jgi:hypothetical protein
MDRGHLELGATGMLDRAKGFGRFFTTPLNGGYLRSVSGTRSGFGTIALGKPSRQAARLNANYPPFRIVL